METTPLELTPETAAALQKAGVNRLSLGVQSFADTTLKSMGRNVGSGEETRQRIAQAAGQFDTLNIDLIFNFPFQTVAQFKSDVEIFKQLNAGQVTFYPLMASPHKK